MNSPTPFRSPSFAGWFGVARRDITPPLEIYARNWGAARNDQAQAVHRPLTLTALVIREQPSAAPLALVALDLGWWRSAEEEVILQAALREAGIEDGRGILALSHTHAGPVFSPALSDQPGGEWIAEYLRTVCQRMKEAVAEALSSAVPGIWESASGTCVLAQNRDLPDPNGSRYLVGWNPEGAADQTLLIGRISDGQGRCLASVVNYACHPTILAWDNTALSPDFVGAMRDLVESTLGAPCLFLQGASGDLAPRHQYVGDPAVADRAGYCLGHAALSLFFHLPSPGSELVFKGVVESGAPLAHWVERPVPANSAPILIRQRRLILPIRDDLPSEHELEKQLADCADPALQERLRRKLHIRRSVGDRLVYEGAVLTWRLGDLLIAAVPNEVYSALQKEARREAGGRPVYLTSLANGGRGYLVPEAWYEKDLYAMWQTPFARGSWEKSRDLVCEEIRALCREEKVRSDLP